MKEIERYWEVLKRSWVYLWPWLLLPLLLLSLLSYGEMLILILRIFLTLFICFGVMSFAAGVFLAVMSHIPGSYFKGLARFNFYQVVPPLRWGFELVDWLIFEEKEDGSDGVEAVEYERPCDDGDSDEEGRRPGEEY